MHREGSGVLLVTTPNVGKSFSRACQLDDDSEAVVRSYAEICQMKPSPFNGTFTEDCLEKSVAHSLLTLITMILCRTNIKNQANYLSRASLSLSQFLTYNSCVRRHQTSSDTRHTEQRETPLPLFFGALVHS